MHATCAALLTQAADLRASTELALRSQAEQASAGMQQRVAALEAECQALRGSHQELLRAKSDAEEQRDCAAGWVVGGWGD